MVKRNHTPEFKAKVAIEGVKGEETTSQIASRYGVHPAQVRSWKREFLKNASTVFGSSNKKENQLEKEIDKLYRKVGQLEMERDFLARKSGLL